MKKIIVLFSFCLIVTIGYSQVWKLKRFEVWGGVSVFQSFGDIGGSASSNTLFGLKDLSLKSSRPGISFGGIYRVNERIYLQGSNSFGFFTQTDKGSKNSIRNYAYSTIADEISAQTQFFFIKEAQNYNYDIMSMRGGLNGINKYLSVYAFAGVGGLFFKVTAKESLVDSPRFSDSQSFTLAFPVGLGVKYAYTPALSFGVELGARLTFTDKLDGLTTAYSKHNDFYYIMNFKAIYRLTKNKGLFQMFRK